MVSLAWKWPCIHLTNDSHNESSSFHSEALGKLGQEHPEWSVSDHSEGLGTSKQETKHIDGVIPHRLKSPSAWASLQLHTWSSEALSRLPLRLGFQERPYPSFWWPLSLRSGLHSPLGSEIHRHYYISNMGEGLDRAFKCILQQLWSNLVWMDAWCSQTPARPRWASLWQWCRSSGACTGLGSPLLHG